AAVAVVDARHAHAAAVADLGAARAGARGTLRGVGDVACLVVARDALAHAGIGAVGVLHAADALAALTLEHTATAARPIHHGLVDHAAVHARGRVARVRHGGRVLVVIGHRGHAALARRGLAVPEHVGGRGGLAVRDCLVRALSVRAAVVGAVVVIVA